MSLPSGLRSVFVACLPAGQPQFRGIRRLLAELGRGQGCCTVRWQGEPLRLERRRVLARVLIAGHGLDERAGLAACGPGQAPLGPHDLTLPAHCGLYLLACFQGRPALRAAWAEGSGVPLERVRGCGGETESALTTCLLLHLLEQGVDHVERWFAAWLEANDALRPHFPRIRRSYGEQAGDPLATLEELADLARATGTEEFLAVIRRRPEYLTGLL